MAEKGRSNPYLEDKDKVKLSVDKWLQLEPAMGLGGSANLTCWSCVKEDKKEPTAVCNPGLCKSPSSIVREIKGK